MAKFLTISFALLLLFACSTSGTGKGSDNPDSAGLSGPVSESGVLESLRADIIMATPESLLLVYNAAQEGELTGSEKGREYQFVAWKLLNILYPEKAGGLGQVLPPPSSKFPKIFSELEQGRLLAIDPEEISYLTLLLPTLVLLYTNDKTTVSTALENLQEANSLNPLSPSILPGYISGRYAERTGDFDNAVREYEAALFVSDTVYPARFGLYRIYIQQGKLDDAIKLEKKLSEDLGGNDNYVYYYATRLLESGETQKSFDQTEALIKNKPDNRDYQLLRARQYIRLNRPQQAETILEALAKQRYDKSEAYYLAYSRTLRLLEKYSAALKIITEALEAYPESEALKLEYGKILVVTGKVEQGSALIAENSGASDSGASVTEGKELLMKQAMKAGDWVKAEQLVLELLQKGRKDSYLMSAAIIYKELGVNREALRYIEELYRKSDDPKILPEYIAILLQAGQDEKVYKLINEGLETIKNSKIRSKLYVYKSHFSFVRTERLRNLTYAKLEDSTNVEALLLLADYFTEIGDREQALSNLRDAALIEPDNLAIRDKIAALE